MTTRRFAIERNVLFLILANGTTAVGMFVLNLAAARRLGPEAFGEYGFALNFAAAFVFLSHLGLDVIVARDAARNPEDAPRLMGAALLAGGTLSVVSAVLVAGGALLFDAGSPALVALLGVAFVANTPSFFCRALFRARQRMALELAVSLLYTVALLGLSLTALFSTASLVVVVSAFPVAAVVASMVALRLLRSEGGAMPMRRPERGYLRSLLVMTLPFTLNGLLLPLFARIDVLMLGRIEGVESVGVYVAALNLVAPLAIVGPSVAQALFPALAVSYAADAQRYRSILLRALGLAGVVNFAAGVFVMLAGSFVLRLAFGTEYAGAGAPMSLLVWAAGCAFLNAILFSALEATGRQSDVTRMLVAGLVVGAVATRLLIPSMGLSGAATAALLAQSTVLLLAFVRCCLPLFGSRTRVVATPAS